jgi:hypothetical protein
MMQDPLSGFKRLLEALDNLAIRYMVGGSLASSLYGVFRSTNDIDIVADIRQEHLARLAAELAPDFYADLDAMREALRRERSFNLIHFASSYKFDIFPLPGDAYYQSQLERSKPEEITLGGTEAMKCRVVTAEDTILAKLVWYRQGGEQSERQWADLRGILSVQGERLDEAYLRRWAQHLGVEDLLERLLSQKGNP